MLFAGVSGFLCVNLGVPGEEAAEDGGGGGGGWGCECGHGKWDGGDSYQRYGKGVEWWTKYYVVTL